MKKIIKKCPVCEMLNITNLTFYYLDECRCGFCKEDLTQLILKEVLGGKG